MRGVEHLLYLVNSPPRKPRRKSSGNRARPAAARTEEETRMQQILTYFFLVVYSVTILGIILVIITENRNPLKTLPWIVVLVLAPRGRAGLLFLLRAEPLQAAHHFAPHAQAHHHAARRARTPRKAPASRPATGRSPHCCSIRCTPYRSTAAASPSIPTDGRRWKR